MAGISNSAMANLLAFVRREPEILDDAHNRYDLDRAGRELLQQVSCTLLLPQSDGGVFDWTIASLPKQLAYYCETAPRFRAILSQLFASRGCCPAFPWRLVLSEDEKCKKLIFGMFYM